MSETDCIKSLYKLAETCPQEEFQRGAFDLLGELIQFDAAGWGETANALDSYVMMRTYTYKISQQVVEDYNKVDHLNSLIPTAIENPFATYNNDVEDGSLYYPDEFMAFVRKYNIPKLLHTLSKHDSDLFLYNITLWRGTKSPRFTEQDRQIKERITPHLIESFRLCRRFDMQRKLFKRWELNRGLATCNQDGILFDTDDYFLKSLQREWPDWQGARLPQELLQALLNNRIYKAKRAFYRSTLLDELYLLVATKLDSLEQLTQREFEIAHAFSNGKTHKQIANAMSISPATVRNHLSKVYQKLKLDSRSKLSQLFS